MSLINVSMNLTAYADAPKTTNPMVKHADYSWSMLGMPTGIPKQVDISLAPGESKQIISSARTLSFNGATSFDVVSVDGVKARLVASIGARTARSDGDGTTEWEIAMVNKLVTMTFTGTGTAPNFAGMQAGDYVHLESPFNALNQGSYQILKVGVDYIQFTNAVAQDETVIGQVQIYSSGPVQIGDFLDLTSSQFAFPNQGVFEIIDVTDTYIEFNNSNAIPESAITGVVSGLVIYPKSYKWLLVAVDRKVTARFNSDASTGCEIEPSVDQDFAENPGILLKRGKVFELTLNNPGLEVVTGVVLLAE